MPAKSKKQFKAMQAAAQGNSTLGIPPSVGQEYAAATPTPSSLPDMSKLVKKKKTSK
jgi:hypothetical protein